MLGKLEKYWVNRACKSYLEQLYFDFVIEIKIDELYDNNFLNR